MAVSAHPTVSTLRELLSGLIDYAGLFPPARLPLETAIKQYARFRHTPDAWMLACFVCPVGRLADLTPYADRFAADPPFRFSILGTGGAEAAGFLETFARDLEAIRTFHAAHPEQVSVEAVEVRLPPALVEAEASALDTFLNRVTDEAADTLPRLFLEISLNDGLRKTLPPLLDALAAHNAAHPALSVALKIRCGGADAAAFPAPAHLAFVVAACEARRVPFKATAGLHHPLRHYNEAAGVPMHGFLNLFGAAALATAHPLGEERLCQVLEDENPAHFHFGPDAFRWQDLEASREAVRQARQHLALSFGSCSFDEPRDDLRTLGLLPPV